MLERSGQILGRYTLAEPVNRYGDLEIYQAVDDRLGSRMLVTLFSTNSLAVPEDKILLFADRLQNLEHPAIVSPVDYGLKDDVAYLVSNYYPGGTLRDLMRAPWQIQDAAQFLAPLVRALQYLHDQGMIHGCVQPLNILLDARKKPLLSDVGLVDFITCAADLSVEQASSTGMRNALYLAPEQWQDLRDERSDLYALGAIFCELVTGQPPFDGETPEVILRQKTAEPLHLAEELRRILPASPSEIILKALAKDPQERFSSMNSLGEAFESLLQTREVNETELTNVRTMAVETLNLKKGKEESPADEGAKTTVAAQMNDIQATLKRDENPVIPPPPETIQYNPASTGGAPASSPLSPPPPLPLQPPEPSKPRIAQTQQQPTGRNKRITLLALAAALMFVCFLVALVGGYFWVTSEKGPSEEEVINSMIATGVSLTETAIATPQSFEFDSQAIMAGELPQNP